MEKLQPQLAPCIRKLRAAIPYVHINNHLDDCMYLFCTVYMICAGHFHGETAEHPWAESNGIRPMTRQMNGGHREEILNGYNNDWNWKKLIKMCMFISFIATHVVTNIYQPNGC